jgi:hypothetical protein
MMIPDLSFENHGIVILARPVSEQGQAWLDDPCPLGG